MYVSLCRNHIHTLSSPLPPVTSSEQSELPEKLSSDLSCFEKTKKKPLDFRLLILIRGVHISLQISILSSLYKHPEAELLDHMVVALVAFEATPYWFPW